MDDWAKRRGHSYATILIDMETGRAVDVLDGRQADTLATWLREHPGVRIVCRDRAGAYAEGTSTGAPEATQVADRWHLWNNLCKAVEITVRTHRADLREPAPEPQPTPQHEPDPTPNTPTPQEHASRPEPRTAARTRERHAAIHELLEQGWTIAAISQHLAPNRTTVRKFRNATTAEELINGPRIARARSFEEFIPYLRQRVTEDQLVNAAQLYAELRALGYRGSRRTVRRYVEPLRAGHTVQRLPLPAPTVREVTRWITSRPDHLTTDDSAKLHQILERSPRLASLSGHVTAFAKMMINRTGSENLKSWLAAVEADDIAQLHSLAKGIDRDLDAVINGLTLPHSSGAVEGNVTRIKALKRSRYGRANFDLLRKIILCSCWREEITLGHNSTHFGPELLFCTATDRESHELRPAAAPQAQVTGHFCSQTSRTRCTAPVSPS